MGGYYAAPFYLRFLSFSTMVYNTDCLGSQAYKFIFTSPSSAQDIECQEDVDEHTPSTTKRSRRNQKAPTRGHVANLLGLKAVTPRSLAYVAVQVSSLSISSGLCDDTDEMI